MTSNAVNALWPRTAIWTAAMNMLGGGSQETAKSCRKREMLSDSAYAIFSKDTKTFSGNFLIDEDFDQYAVSPGNALIMDGFLPDEEFNKGDNVFELRLPIDRTPNLYKV